MRVTSLGHAGMLIETEAGSIVCDPWFLPAFFGSWFVFPRNDRLDAELMERIESADYLYISHLHADHFDEPWLAEHISRDTTVLVPGYPTRELERRIRALGFGNIQRTVSGEELELRPGLTIAIHTETSITDGPGGDSALVVTDGISRVVNQNDCRTTDLAALRAHGPVDLHWLQYSGAIWYPMVYAEPDDRMAELCAAKVASQYSRAMRYVETIDARAVVPSAGPPCFLDPQLSHLNVVTGEERSIFPDASQFVRMLDERWKGNGILNMPGTSIDVTPDSITVTHPIPDRDVAAIFQRKAEYLAEYADDWKQWLDTHRATWTPRQPELVGRLKAWWEPLLAMAPLLRQSVGANVLIRTVDADGVSSDQADDNVLIDFPAGVVRSARADDTHAYRFEIQRELVETVTDAKAVDWSNALFLSCRFSAWREGPFNEYVYNFFKSLSVERMRRAESEVHRKLEPPDRSQLEEITIGGHVVERYCPHRQADLSIFGEIDDDTGGVPQLVCTLHGWRFELDTGRCLTSNDCTLHVRPTDR